VQSFLRSARAANTVKAYDADLRDFVAWGGRVPAKPELVAEYLADLSKTRTVATIKRRKAALTSVHRERGHADPCAAEVVRATMKGIRRTAVRTKRQMKPMLADQVARAALTLPDNLKGIRDRAILLLGLAGAFRRSELVAINVEDCSFSRSELVVRLKSSKTDPEAHGRDVVIPAGGAVCPVKTVKRWLKSSQLTNGRLFRRFTADGALADHGMRPEAVAAVVKIAASRLGLDPRLYAGHSLRAGYVTTSALHGVPLWQIKKHTGHSTETMVETYVRTESGRKARSLF
jgi:integrase